MYDKFKGLLWINRSDQYKKKTKNILHKIYFFRLYFLLIYFYYKITGVFLLKKKALWISPENDFLSKLHPYWENRIRTVIDSPDNAFIKRHLKAGQLEEGWLIMHNGVKVAPLSYYGTPFLKMLVLNRGVHEPQEERLFQEILPYIPEKGCIVELGAYWGFYSLWFAKEVKSARCILVEPIIENHFLGQINFKKNNKTAEFLCGFIAKGKHNIENIPLAGIIKGTPIFSIKDIFNKYNLKKIDILHVDIQGAELKMLEGATTILNEGLIDYLFISTHSNDIHYSAISILNEYQYTILESVDLDESYSDDGVILAARIGLNFPKTSISKNTNRVEA